MARIVDDLSADVPIGRHGRIVIPRQLRSALGPVPGAVRATRVEGGVLLERPPAGEVVTADEGSPVLVLGRPVSNEDVLAAIDAEQADR